MLLPRRDIFWSNYSDLIRPGPSVAEVKYYNLAILVPSKVPAQKRQRTENVFVLQRIILQNRLVGEWKVWNVVCSCQQKWRSQRCLQLFVCVSDFWLMKNGQARCFGYAAMVSKISVGIFCPELMEEYLVDPYFSGMATLGFTMNNHHFMFPPNNSTYPKN